MKLLTIINNIISPQKDIGTPLGNTREKIIRLSFLLASIVSLFLFIVRLFEQNEDKSMLIAVVIAFVFSISFLSLCYKGYSQVSILIANALYLVIAFYEGYRLGMPMQTYIYFSLIPAISLFLINNRNIRFIFLSINILIFIVLNVLTQSDTLPNLLTFIVMALICYTVLFSFVELMEKQEHDLVLAMNAKIKTLQLLENKHQDLLLFNNMMNHDIKAPLRSIKGFSYLLKKTKPTQEQKEFIDFISNSANNLEQLISDLLLYNKMNTVEIQSEDVDVNIIIDSVCLSLKYDIEQKNISIIRKDLPLNIQANADGLRTIFQNLISNSIKYQPKNIENHIPEIIIRHEEDKDFDVFYIDDNGIGIKEENLERLFTPFIRFHSAAEYEGTGLGLSICKKIIEKHNGTIQVIPKTTQGTSFCLKLPKS